MITTMEGPFICMQATFLPLDDAILRTPGLCCCRGVVGPLPPLCSDQFPCIVLNKVPNALNALHFYKAGGRVGVPQTRCLSPRQDEVFPRRLTINPSTASDWLTSFSTLPLSFLPLKRLQSASSDQPGASLSVAGMSRRVPNLLQPLFLCL